MILELLAAQPAGYEHRDLSSALGGTLIGECLLRELRALHTAGRAARVGSSVRTRWCLVEHIGVAQARATELMHAGSIRRAGKSPHISGPRGIPTATPDHGGLRKAQATVRAWPKPFKPGPSSVFDLGDT